MRTHANPTPNADRLARIRDALRDSLRGRYGARNGLRTGAPARPRTRVIRLNPRRRAACDICGVKIVRGMPRFRLGRKRLCNVCEWARRRLEGGAR
jgi:hypothetical protein